MCLMGESNGANGGGNGHGAVVGDLRRPLAVDLFAGAGGLSLGLEQAGFDVVASVEYDAIHAAVHEFNFPMTTALCADVAQLDAEELRDAIRAGRYRHGHRGEWDGEIDLIAGGPPCQGFSLMGKRLVDDPRNQLVFHFFRLVSELRPRYFVMENVPGMLAGGHSTIIDQLVAEFESDGYQIVKPIQILNAAEFGAPQLRRRVFLIGAREGATTPRYPSPTSPLGPERAGPTVGDALLDLPDLDGFDALQDSDEVPLPASEIRGAARSASAYARRLRGLVADPADLSHPRKWNANVLTSSMRTKHTELSVSRFAATAPGTVEPTSRFLRLDPAGLCNTIRAGTGSERGAYTSPRPIHPRYPRVISVREAARLHGFPDWFRLHRTKWHGFRQVGNAVVPPVGRAVGQSIVEALGVQPLVPTHTKVLGSPELLALTMRDAALHFGIEREAAPAPRRRTRTPTS